MHHLYVYINSVILLIVQLIPLHNIAAFINICRFLNQCCWHNLTTLFQKSTYINESCYIYIYNDT